MGSTGLKLTFVMISPRQGTTQLLLKVFLIRIRKCREGFGVSDALHTTPTYYGLAKPSAVKLHILNVSLVTTLHVNVILRSIGQALCSWPVQGILLCIGTSEVVLKGCVIPLKTTSET